MLTRCNAPTPVQNYGDPEHKGEAFIKFGLREISGVTQELWTADIEDDLIMSLDAIIANCRVINSMKGVLQFQPMEIYLKYVAQYNQCLMGSELAVSRMSSSQGQQLMEQLHAMVAKEWE